MNSNKNIINYNFVKLFNLNNFLNKLAYLFYPFVDWKNIICYQKLSESFMRKFQDKIFWPWISGYQKLSENFIREFQNKVDWYWICMYSKLSESFIREFQNKVQWDIISQYQKLTEDFIREFKDKVDWKYISYYQKLSTEFISEFNLQDKINELKPNNTLYWTKEEKLEFLKQYPQYEIIDNSYIIAYKGIRSDRYSRYNFQYQYLPGNTYECHADHNLNNIDSFGFSAWTYEKAKTYCDELVIEVKIYIEDIAAIVHDGGKIRCSKFEVLN